MLSDTQVMESIRETEFPIAAEWTYLNHAFESPNPTRAISAVNDRVAQAQRPYLAFPQHDHALSDIKRRLSGMTGYAPEQFALLTNVGDATSTIANGLHLQSGDEIIMVEREFPSFVFPWRVQERRGARCIFVPKDGVATNLDRLDASITDRTRVIAISHVDFQSGFNNDISALGELARARGVFLVLDVSQSLGARPYDYASAGVAAIVGVGFKWLMGLHGLSLLGVADWAQDAIEPTIAGRNGMTDAWMDGDLDLNWLPDARRYQSGNLNWLAVWGLAASLSLQEDVGYANVESSAMRLRDRLVAGLEQQNVEITSDLHPHHASTIVTFKIGSPERTESFVQKAAADRISLTYRGGWVRSAVHFWNDETDIDRLLNFIDGYRPE